MGALIDSTVLWILGIWFFVTSQIGLIAFGWAASIFKKTLVSQIREQLKELWAEEEQQA